MQDIVERATDIGVLLGLSGLDVLDGNPVLLNPYQDLSNDVFWAVAYSYGPRLAAPLDTPVKAQDYTLG